MKDHVDHIVEAWRRERPDLDVAALGQLARLFRTAHAADAALAEGLAEHRLQRGWFDLLAALRRAGSPYELNPTQLMRTTMLSSGGMTKRLDRLAEAGLVGRRPDPGDRRGTLVRLTARGRKAIDAALEAHAANEERLLSALAPAERNALDRLLRKLLASLSPASTIAPRTTGRSLERSSRSRTQRSTGTKPSAVAAPKPEATPSATRRRSLPRA
jgi:DNA-binding MarR family transcriptional regulator